MVQKLLEDSQINIIKCFFINCTILVVLVEFLLHSMGAYLPDVIIQNIRYGKLNFKSDRKPLVNKMEVPKSWFKHFYIFASIWSLFALGESLKGLSYRSSAPNCVMQFLDFFGGGKGRKVLIDSTSGLVVLVLITIQVLRRFYETNFVQIFSSKSKMSYWHYILGYAHHFGIVVAVLANTEGFVRGTTPSSFSFSKITWMQYIYCTIFYFGWYLQYTTNRMLAVLRKDYAGNKASEEYFMPFDGLFRFLSSPHMLFEVVMYISICGIIPACSTWWYITIWVITNQTIVAWLTHKWYKENIKDYPTNRYAIYPLIL